MAAPIETPEEMCVAALAAILGFDRGGKAGAEEYFRSAADDMVGRSTLGCARQLLGEEMVCDTMFGQVRRRLLLTATDALKAEAHRLDTHATNVVRKHAAEALERVESPDR